MLSNITLEPEILQELQDIAHRLRIHSITSTNAAKSGHPTSCASIAEIMSVLFFNVMRYYVAEPRNPVNDRIILSKGHAAPILYAAWAEAGLFPATDLLNLRKFDSDLEGHPTPKLNFIDVGSGSLGQGVSIACGMSYVGKYIDKSSYRTYAIVGDGESAEGSIWEALHFASHYNLDNLCVIFDVNRLGQSEPTSLQHNIEIYRSRLDAFGWNAIVVDGHDVEELCKAFYEASITKDKPTAIVAKTFKGKHFRGIEDKENWHGKPLGSESDGVINHLKSLIHNMETIKIKPKEPLKNDVPNINITNIKLDSLPNYGVDAEVSTRRAYGIALAKIGKTNKRVIALDGDTKNSTFSENLKKICPDQFIECFIAEQNMVGVAIGTGCRERTIPFVSTFAAFFSRAYDQIRMGAISQANVKFVGSHCGVSIGEDGASQMALEDLTLFRTIPKCTIFYPSDAVSCERAVELAANKIGMCYIRTSRPDTRILYKEDEKFEIGRAKILKQCACDQVLLIGAGITIHEVLIAADKLREQQIYARVMDPFTIKPLDNSRVLFETLHCAGRVVVVEDHYSEGGLGEAVKAAVAGHSMVSLRHLAVSEIPHSGKPMELLNKYGLTVPHIIKAVRDVIRY